MPDHSPVDRPREPLRHGSAMPTPHTGPRRIDHPSPEGLPPPEVKTVSAWRVSCDGGEGALGHPRVWYTIPREQGFVDCGYCDARFVHSSGAARVTTEGPERREEGRLGTDRLADHQQPADLHAVMGKQPAEGAGDGDVAGTDGASARRP